MARILGIELTGDYAAGPAIKEAVGDLRAFEVASDKASKSVERLAAQRANLRQLSVAYKDLAATATAGSDEQAIAAKKAADAEKLLGRQIAMTAGEAKASTRAATEQAASFRALEGRASKLGGTMRMLAGQALGLGAAYGAFEFFKGADQQAQSYNVALTRLETQTGMTAAQVQKLQPMLERLAPSLRSTPTELAQAFYYAYSATSDFNKSLELTTLAAKEARISGANIVDVIRQLNGAVFTGIDHTKDYKKVMGELNSIVAQGSMTFQELTGALERGLLPMSKQLGITLPEVGTALDVMTHAGMQASTAGQYVTQFLAAIINNTPKANKALSTLGLSMADVVNDIRRAGLIQTIGMLQQKMSTLPPAEQLFAEKAIFGRKQAVTAFDAITTSMGATARILQRNIDAATSFDTDWTKYTKSWSSATVYFRSSLQTLEEEVGRKLLPEVTGYMNQAGKWLAQTKHQKEITDDATKALHGMLTAAKDGVKIVEEIDKATGSFSRTLELLVAIKAASWGLNAAAGIGKFAAALGGAGGATAEVEGLSAALGGLGPVTVGVTVAIGYEILGEVKSAVQGYKSAGVMGAINSAVHTIANSEVAKIAEQTPGIGTAIKDVMSVTGALTSHFAGHGSSSTAAPQYGPSKGYVVENGVVYEKRSSSTGGDVLVPTNLTPAQAHEVGVLRKAFTGFGTKTPAPASSPSSDLKKQIQNLANQPGHPTAGAGSPKETTAPTIHGPALINQATERAIDQFKNDAKTASGQFEIMYLQAEGMKIKDALAALAKKAAAPGTSAKQRSAIETEMRSLDDTYATIRKEIQSKQKQNTAKAKAETEAALKKLNATLYEQAKTIPASLTSEIAHAKDEAKQASGAVAEGWLKKERSFLKKAAQVLKQNIADTPDLTRQQTNQIRSEIQNLNSQVASVNKQIVKNLKAQAAAIKANYKQQISAAESTISSAFSQIISDAKSAFDQQTQNYISNVLGPKFYQNGAQTPLEAELAQMQTQDTAKSLQDQLAAAQKQLATDTTGALQQHIVDLATGAITNVYGPKASADQLAADQQAVEQAQRAIQENNLSIQATAQRTKADSDYAAAVKSYEQQRSLEESQMVLDLQAFGKGLDTGKTTVAGLTDELLKFGLNIANFPDLGVPADQIWNDMDALSSAVRALATVFADEAQALANVGASAGAKSAANQAAGIVGGLGSFPVAQKGKTPVPVGGHAVPMAAGALVRGGLGGVHALIGEKSYDEAVIPLPRGLASVGAPSAAPSSLVVNVTVNAPRYLGDKSDLVAALKSPDMLETVGTAVIMASRRGYIRQTDIR